MSDKAMKQRHWDRITNLTGYTFDIGFYLCLFDLDKYAFIDDTFVSVVHSFKFSISRAEWDFFFLMYQPRDFLV